MDFPDLSALEDNNQSISYHVEEIDFVFSDINQENISKWLNAVAELENNQIIELNYIFCSDVFLHKINLDFLNHDTLTDIITFDLGNAEDAYINGDIYISIDRVKENAIALNVDFNIELRRVLVHGLLHLIGYPDKTKQESELMRRQEDKSLCLYKPV
ncbi:MAG: rRNA maturation RNase YbeY [Saprospiraceae bacterium]|nr:rRNA maturation RNase YbeY [Saprospiraceae bacterium]